MQRLLQSSDEIGPQIDTGTFVGIFVTIVSFSQAIFFWYQRTYHQSASWENVYVVTVEGTFYLLRVILGPAATITISAGMKHRSPAKTLQAIIADQVMIVFGMAAAISSNDTIKAILFVMGASAGFVVFKTVAESFITAYGTYPTTEAKRMLILSSLCFAVGWGAFPVLFLLGPEGYGAISQNSSKVAHGVADLIAKNLYGILSWSMRFQVLKAGVRTRSSRSSGRKAVEEAKPAGDSDPTGMSLVVDGSHNANAGGAIVNIEGTPTTAKQRAHATRERDQKGSHRPAPRGPRSASKSPGGGPRMHQHRGRSGGKGSGAAGGRAASAAESTRHHGQSDHHGHHGGKSDRKSKSTGRHGSPRRQRVPDKALVALEAYRLVARALDQRRVDATRELPGTSGGEGEQEHQLQRWALHAVTSASRHLNPPQQGHAQPGGPEGAVAAASSGSEDPMRGTMEALRVAAMRLDPTGSLVVDVLSGKESRAVRHAAAGRVTSRLGELLVQQPPLGAGTGLEAGGPRMVQETDMIRRVLRRGLAPEAKAQAATINVLLVEPSAERQAYVMLALQKVSSQSGLDVVIWPVFSLSDAAESVRRGVPQSFDVVYVSAQALAAWLREQWRRLCSGGASAIADSSHSVATGEYDDGAAGGGDDAFDMQSPMQAMLRQRQQKEAGEHGPGVGRGTPAGKAASPPLSPDFASPKTARPGYFRASGRRDGSPGRRAAGAARLQEERCPSLVAAALARLLFVDGDEDPTPRMVNDTAIELLREAVAAREAGNPMVNAGGAGQPHLVVYAPSEVALLREARLEHWDDEEADWEPEQMQVGSPARAGRTGPRSTGGRSIASRARSHSPQARSKRRGGRLAPLQVDQDEQAIGDGASSSARGDGRTVASMPVAGQRAARARRGSGLTIPRRSPAGAKALKGYASPAVSLVAGGRGKRVQRGRGVKEPASKALPGATGVPVRRPRRESAPTPGSAMQQAVSEFGEGSVTGEDETDAASADASSLGQASDTDDVAESKAEDGGVRGAGSSVKETRFELGEDVDPLEAQAGKPRRVMDWPPAAFDRRSARLGATRLMYIRELVSARQAAGLSGTARSGRSAGSSAQGGGTVFVDASVAFQMTTLLAEVQAGRQAPSPSKMANMAAEQLLRGIYGVVLGEVSELLQELEDGRTKRARPDVSALAPILGARGSVRHLRGTGTSEAVPVVHLRAKAVLDRAVARARTGGMQEERRIIAGMIAELSSKVAAQAAAASSSVESRGTGRGSSGQQSLSRGYTVDGDDDDVGGVHDDFSGRDGDEERIAEDVGARLRDAANGAMGYSGGRQGVGMQIDGAAGGRRRSLGRRGSVGSVSSMPGLPPKGYGRRDSSLDIAGAALFDDYDFEIEDADALSKDSTETPAQERAAMATIRSLQKSTPPPPPPRRTSISPAAPPRRALDAPLTQAVPEAVPLPASAASDEGDFTSDGSAGKGQAGGRVGVHARATSSRQEAEMEKAHSTKKEIEMKKTKARAIRVGRQAVTSDGRQFAGFIMDMSSSSRGTSSIDLREANGDAIRKLPSVVSVSHLFPAEQSMMGLSGSVVHEDRRRDSPTIADASYSSGGKLPSGPKRRHKSRKGRRPARGASVEDGSSSFDENPQVRNARQRQAVHQVENASRLAGPTPRRRKSSFEFGDDDVDGHSSSEEQDVHGRRLGHAKPSVAETAPAIRSRHGTMASMPTTDAGPGSEDEYELTDAQKRRGSQAGRRGSVGQLSSLLKGFQEAGGDLSALNVDKDTRRKLIGLLRHNQSNAHNQTMGRIPFIDHRNAPEGMSQSTTSSRPTTSRSHAPPSGESSRPAPSTGSSKTAYHAHRHSRLPVGQQDQPHPHQPASRLPRNRSALPPLDVSDSDGTGTGSDAGTSEGSSDGRWERGREDSEHSVVDGVTRAPAAPEVAVVKPQEEAAEGGVLLSRDLDTRGHAGSVDPGVQLADGSTGSLGWSDGGTSAGEDGGLLSPGSEDLNAARKRMQKQKRAHQQHKASRGPAGGHPVPRAVGAPPPLVSRYQSNRPRDEIDDQLGGLGVQMVDSVAGSTKFGESGGSSGSGHGISGDSAHSQEGPYARDRRRRGGRVMDSGSETGTDTSSSSSDSGDILIDDLNSRKGGSRGGRGARRGGRGASRRRSGDLASIDSALGPRDTRGRRRR